MWRGGCGKREELYFHSCIQKIIEV